MSLNQSLDGKHHVNIIHSELYDDELTVNEILDVLMGETESSFQIQQRIYQKMWDNNERNT